MDPIGREAELSLVTARLRDRRLVTLVGPGGIGKTTLARAAADRAAAHFGEGSRFIDLTRVGSASGVKESVAAQFGYSSYRALMDAPGDHSVLVVVDNCEHVLDAAAEVIDELLDVCQMPTVLATSRVALELAGEVVVPLGPLALPPAGMLDAPAVRLFVERSRDAGRDLAPSESVAELCRRLDGVPLAIELAAARTRSMTPEEVLGRLGAGIDVLDRPRRRSAPRHQSLRAAIDWSHDLLAPAEKALFARLSVIPGPFTAAFAHSVASAPGSSPTDTQDLLDDLVATSMVVAETSGPTTRYRVLEALRTYGRERLEAEGAADDVEARFVDHVVELVADIVVRGSSGWSADALADLLALYDSISAAVRWCVANDEAPSRAMLLAAALWGVVHQAHTEEVGELAEEVLARWPDTDEPLRADAAATAATCRYMLGDDAGAVALATAALDDAERSPFAPATLRRAIAQSTRATGDATGAIEWFAATGDAARRLGMIALAAESDAARAQVLADLDRTDEALDCARRARSDAQAGGSQVAAAWALVIEGSVLLRVDPAAAGDVLEAGRQESEALQYAAGTSVAERLLAQCRLLQGDVPGAARHALRLLDQLLARGSTYELRLVFDVASAVLAAAGRQQAASDLAATARSLPVVSVTASVGHELFPLDAAGGTVLGIRDGILVSRAELDLLVADGGQPSRVTAIGERMGVFRRAGELWEVGYLDALTTVKGSKGMDDIARLLRTPHREVHCLELAGGAVVEGSTGEVLDATARRAYEQRVRDLQAEIDEADEHHDPARADRARAELDAVVDQLTEALGIGGRSRTKGSSAERARSAVTQRIRSTVRRLAAVDPALGRHLEASLRTGTFCAYTPEHPVRWQV